MNPPSVITRTGTALIAGLLSFNALAVDTYVLTDAQEITGYLSGYDIKSVTFSIDTNDVMTMEI
jgi:hypothetical protein